MTKLTCKICGGEKITGFHIRKHGISLQNYYDKFIKIPTEGFCKNCNQPTKFKNLREGYRTTCSQYCSRKLMSSPESREKYKKKCLEKYGVENTSLLQWVKEKNSNTHKLIFSDPTNRKKISIATKIAMKREDVRKKFLKAVREPKSDETIKKMSIAAKQKFINDPTIKNRIYTYERNKKVSESKIDFWKNNVDGKKRVGNIWKIWKKRDEDGWRKHLLKASQLGFNAIFHKRGGETRLERKIYKFLNDHKIRFEKQYELEYRLYDAFLSDYNVLLEIDGEFWHKKTIEECVYPFQKNSFYNDIKKNKIAEKHNIPLLRIRENEPPEKILDYLNFV